MDMTSLSDILWVGMTRLSDILDDPNILHGIVTPNIGEYAFHICGHVCTEDYFYNTLKNKPLLLWLAYKSREGIISYV
jgi:hypothetical protein